MSRGIRAALARGLGNEQLVGDRVVDLLAAVDLEGPDLRGRIAGAIEDAGQIDTFTAALTVALVEGQDPETALAFACAAGAAAATKMGAQPSLPTRQEVLALL